MHLHDTVTVATVQGLAAITVFCCKLPRREDMMAAGCQESGAVQHGISWFWVHSHHGRSDLEQFSSLVAVSSDISPSEAGPRGCGTRALGLWQK